MAHANQNVRLTWDAGADGLAIGYNLYYGTSSGNYSQRLKVGNNTSVVVSNLVEGVTYYFALTAYDALGVESVLSNEVSYSVPVIPPPNTNASTLVLSQTIASPIANVFPISSSGTAPSRWSLQASTDLLSWNSISLGSNTVNATIIVASSPQMFFRMNSDTAGIFLTTQRAGTNALNGSFFITSTGTPSRWTIESSVDLTAWSPIAAGTNIPVNIAVIPSSAPQMFFRMKGE